MRPSTRARGARLDTLEIQWIQCPSAIGLFDQSLTESVLDSLDLDYPDRPVKCYCIDGGGSLLTKKLLSLIRSKPQMSKRVTAINIDRNRHCDINMSVHVDSETLLRRYATVCNTISLACMQRMD